MPRSGLCSGAKEVRNIASKFQDYLSEESKKNKELLERYHNTLIEITANYHDIATKNSVLLEDAIKKFGKDK